MTKPEGKKYRVTIHKADKGDQATDVFLAVNGHAIQVQFGKEVLIGAEFVEVLRNSTIETVGQDPATEKLVVQRVPRYAFQAEAA